MDNLAWEITPAGIVLPVQAQPKARRHAVLGLRDGRLLVAVTAAPEQGKANAALMEVLADFFHLKRRQLSLLTGQTSSKKRFLITGAQLDQLTPYLDAIT